jgi:hypothetical protein
MTHASSDNGNLNIATGKDMRNQRSSGFGGPDWEDRSGRYSADVRSRNWSNEPANSNSPEEIFGEVGLMLVVILGIVLAVNMLLIALHIS